jgi:hypothetical protein
VLVMIDADGRQRFTTPDRHRRDRTVRDLRPAGSRTATDEVEVAAQEERADVLGVAADSMGSLAPAVSACWSVIDEYLNGVGTGAPASSISAAW